MEAILAASIHQTVSVVAGTALGFLVCTALGFYAASRGHWSALLCAIPGLLVGGFLSIVLLQDLGAFDPVTLLFLTPAALSAASIVLWFRRRKAKRSPRQENA